MTERAGGAILVSGVVKLESCVLVGNEARVGPGVYNTVEVTLVSTDVCDNPLICDDGSFLDWNVSSAYEVACDNCPADGNNCNVLYYNNSVQLCEPVLEHTTSVSSNGTLESLDVESGYWRSSNFSRDIRECYELDACVGGTQGLCSSGYEGPFCAVCAKGYARGLGYTCFECSNVRRTVTLAVVLTVLAAVALVAVLVRINVLGFSAAETTTSTSAELPVSSPRWGRYSAPFEWARASHALKIVIVAWQIVTQFANVTSTTYPEVYAAFLGWVDVLNLNIAWIISAGCLIKSNFYHSLLVSTIGYLGIAGLVLLSHAISNRRCHAENGGARAKNDRRHASMLFWISLLIYATVSSSIFRTFACDHLDNGRSFLRADHSLECYTTMHKAFMAYAGVMVVIYPLGIPACYAFVLYRNRASLLTGNQVSSNAEAEICRGLWAPYRPQVYFYEVVECFRRVLLSGAVVFIFPNSAGQVAISVLLAMLFAGAFMVLDPYESYWHSWLARTSHAVVILSLYLALLQKVEDIGDDGSSKNVFACVLVALNCGLVIAVGIEAYGMCSLTVQEIREPAAHSVSCNSVRSGGVGSLTELPPVWGRSV